MHNVNVEAVEETAARAREDPGTVVSPVRFDGELQTEPGAPQFRATIPVPNGEAGRVRGRLPAADGRHCVGAQPARILLLGRPGLLRDDLRLGLGSRACRQGDL